MPKKILHSWDSIPIRIASWDHYFRKLDDGSFTVWHHNTIADAGYGTEVFVKLPADYFLNHSISEFYDSVAKEHICVNFDKKAVEIKNIRDLFGEYGLV